MNRKQANKKILSFPSILLIAFILVSGILYYFISSKKEIDNKKEDLQPQEALKEKKNIPSSYEIPSVLKPIIDYGEIGENREFQKLMSDRKKEVGIEKSLDIIVRSNEIFKIGDAYVSMTSVLEKAYAEKGKIFEKQIDDNQTNVKNYGVYIVKAGDNLWDIHFNFLKEFYAKKGIVLDPKADEPKDRGESSGIGKILKFSENMVIIYNLKTKKLDYDINMIEPLSKVVIYNMSKVFGLLEQIDYHNIKNIKFDGDTIWVSDTT